METLFKFIYTGRLKIDNGRVAHSIDQRILRGLGKRQTQPV